MPETYAHRAINFERDPCGLTDFAIDPTNFQCRLTFAQTVAMPDKRSCPIFVGASARSDLLNSILDSLALFSRCWETSNTITVGYRSGNMSFTDTSSKSERDSAFFRTASFAAFFVKRQNERCS